VVLRGQIKASKVRSGACTMGTTRRLRKIRSSRLRCGHMTDDNEAQEVQQMVDEVTMV
jgi:hypothetical protein